EGGRGKHDASKARDQELEKKSDAEKHGNFKLDTAAPHCPEPIEDFDPGRNTNAERSDREKAVGIGVHPHREHVVSPHAHAQKCNTNSRADHDWVSKDWLARKYRNNYRHKSKGRNNQDVHLGVSEYPEKMHPEHGRSPCLRVEEVPSQISIDEKHDLRRR